jgi:hypothetical protein
MASSAGSRSTGSAASWGTAIVLLHLLVNAVHVAAHLDLHIYLGRADTAFVLIVICLCPLVAMALLWTSWDRAGLLLLAVSMAASLLFGLYHHFVAAGPDHISGQVRGFWETVFVFSAYGLLAAQAAGTYVGLYFLQRRK